MCIVYERYSVRNIASVSNIVNGDYGDFSSVLSDTLRDNRLN
jgi:hypothetical protein